MLQQNNIKVLKQEEWYQALKLLLLGQEFNKYENDNSIQDTDLTNYCPIHSTKSLLSSHSTSGYKIILIVYLSINISFRGDKFLPKTLEK